MIVVMDASCTRFFTHNAAYMQAYAKRAHEINLGVPIECWIGEAADSEVREGFTLPVYSILRSPIYSFQKNRPAYYFRDRVLNHLLLFLNKSRSNGFLFRYTRETVFNFYTLPAVKRARDIAKYSKEISLLLPSADGLTLRLAKKLIDLGFPVKTLTVRTITAESRGVYGIENLSLFLKNLHENHPHIEIRVGWESKTVSEELEEQGLIKNWLHWAPMPTNKSYEEKILKVPLRIGFLGVARRNKGFDLIPEIIDCLKDIGFSIEFVVQLTANPWVGYEQSLKNILQKASNTQLLNPRMTHDQLLYEIGQVDLLIMPYSTEQYSRAGSGILYQGADFLVPSITFKGLGFSWDIESFEIGATFESLQQLETMISFANIERWKENCALYNQARNQAVDFLLSLHSS